MEALEQADFAESRSEFSVFCPPCIQKSFLEIYGQMIATSKKDETELVDGLAFETNLDISEI